MNLDKAFTRLEKMLLRLDKGELKLEEGDYKYLKDEIEDIEKLIESHPEHAQTLIGIKKRLLFHFEALKDLITIEEMEIHQTKDKVNDFEYFPQNLKDILTRLLQESEVDIQKLKDLYTSIALVEDEFKELDLSEHEYHKLIKIIEVIKKNIHKLLPEIKKEKQYILEFEMRMLK